MEEAATWRTHRAQGQVNALSMFCVAAALSNFSCSASPCRHNPPSPHAHTRAQSEFRLTTFECKYSREISTKISLWTQEKLLICNTQCNKDREKGPYVRISVIKLHH